MRSLAKRNPDKNIVSVTFSPFFSLIYLMGHWLFQNDVDLIHEIEAVLGKQLDKFDCKEKEVLDNITKVRSLLNSCLVIFTSFARKN